MINKKVQSVVEVLGRGELAVIPTDTVLGIVADAFCERAIEKLYKVRRRNEKKPCIVLVSDIYLIFDKFSILKTNSLEEILGCLWSSELNSREKYEKLKTTSFSKILDKVDLNRPISVVLDCFDEKLSHLHLGTNTIAFRIPRIDNLNGRFVRDVLNSPISAIIAPSANLEGESIARSIEEAREYFGLEVEIYIDNLEEPSKNVSHVLKYTRGNWSILR